MGINDTQASEISSKMNLQKICRKMNHSKGIERIFTNLIQLKLKVATTFNPTMILLEFPKPKFNEILLKHQRVYERNPKSYFD